MRSTAGAATPSGSTFKPCVFAATPSLKTLIELPVGVVAAVAPAGPLLREPGVEPRGDESVRACLTLGGPHRERVGVLVLRVTGVAPDPGPVDRVPRRRLHQFLPQRQVLDDAALATPASGDPVWHPLRHPLDEVG